MGPGGSGAFPGATQACTPSFWQPGAVGWPSLGAGEGGCTPVENTASALRDCAGLPLPAGAETPSIPSASPRAGSLGLA